MRPFLEEKLTPSTFRWQSIETNNTKEWSVRPLMVKEISPRLIYPFANDVSWGHYVHADVDQLIKHRDHIL